MASLSAARDPGAVRHRLETAAFVGLLAFVAALQFSIAAAQILLAFTLLTWVALAIDERQRVEAPTWFWPLLAYAAVTVLATVFSLDPAHSATDLKQLLLFLIVPAAFRLARGPRANVVLTVVISVGAAAAAVGIFQYGILEYDNLGRRPQGTLTHYMTYSGVIMLAVGAAVSRVLFDRHERAWAALVLPALVVSLALTFTRSAWVGACAAVGLLLAMKDRRLLALLPVVAALFFAVAPPRLADRLYSVVDLNDPTNRDRLAMVRTGIEMIEDHPLTGVGPDMVKVVYEDYRDPQAVEAVNPHLHNVPLQIAAERGLPALAAWLVFVGLLVVHLARAFRTGAHQALAATGLAAVTAMATAGLFEYNFGDSEFLMLFLVLVTLPFAAARDGELAAR